MTIHNPAMISIWRANMDYQPVVSKMLALKYIEKYASKTERKLESCIDMLTHICKQQMGEDHTLSTYRRFMSEIIADRDIGAQETCHMLQKLPLVVSSHSFITLNVRCKVFHQINKNPGDNTLLVSYLHSYIQRLAKLELMSVIDTARAFSFSAARKGCKWKVRKQKTIVSVFPHFYSIPNEESEQFETFCWSELLFYKHYRSISIDIGLTKDDIVANWKQMKLNNYHVWHVDHLIATEVDHEQDLDDTIEVDPRSTSKMNE